MARSYPGSRKAIIVSKRCEIGEDLLHVVITPPEQIEEEKEHDKYSEPEPEEDSINFLRGER